MNGEGSAAAEPQDRINQAEWENPGNWSDSLFAVYFSKRDSRVWVPKRRPSLGWTLNFGHSSSMVWLAGIILLPLLARSFRGRRD